MGEIHVRFPKSDVEFQNFEPCMFLDSNLIPQLFLVFENDQFEVQMRNKTKIGNPHQISQNPDQISKIWTGPGSLPKSELTTPSKLRERSI